MHTRAGGLILGLAGLWLGACTGETPAAPASSVPPASAEPALLSDVAKAAGAKPPLVPCPSQVPEALNPPATATLVMALPADGVQVYTCSSAKPGEAPAWALTAPHALLGAGKDVVGTHFAGPTWQGLDGSAVKGAKLAAADAPNASAIPWLLLSATPAHEGSEGSFTNVTFIQRLDTQGGKAPASGCDVGHVGAQVLVPYKAKYYFYRSTLSGEAVQQCRSSATKNKS